MNFIILTHEREFQRASGTGKIVKNILNNNCEIIQWSRVEPPKKLLNEDLIKKSLLIYPEDSSILEITTENYNFNNIENFILLDGTWQETKKIYNKSNYLKYYRKLAINSEHKSIFNKRRNQIDGGLCTAECVIELLKLTKNNKKADELKEKLIKFLG